MRRLRGLLSLVHDSIEALTDLIEDTHLATARKPVALLEIIPNVGSGARVVGAIHDGIAGVAYGSVRAVNRGVQRTLDVAGQVVEQAGVARALAAQLDAAQEQALTHWADTAQSALNAWLGDFLARRENELALAMSFRAAGRPIPWTRAGFAAAYPHAGSRVCIFIHGLGCSEATWRMGALEQFGDRAANYGSYLARDLGYTPLYLHYNTGLHVSSNARELAARLEQLLASYPCAIEEIALVGHSMGGLVARGAAHYGKAAGHAWIERLTHVLCIGSPNLGAPLEKATHMLAALLARFDAPGTQIPARLLNTRSVGIKDLRFGYVLDEDWTDKDPDAFLSDARHDVPMLDAVTYGFIAATFLPDPQHAFGRLLGDLLVRVPSAAGRAETPARHVPFHIGEVVHGVHHIAMLNHPLVYAQVLRFLSERVPVACTPS